MINSNLTSLMSSLSEAEFKKLGKFISSPYFNVNSKLTELFELLKPYYPGYDSLEISKENFFRRLYGKDKYVEGTMFYLLSELENLICKFISIEKMQPEMQDVTLLSDLNKKGLNSLFEKKYKLLKKKINDLNDPYNYFRLTLAEINSFHIEKQKKQLTIKDKFKKEWFEPTGELIVFFLKKILKQNLTLISYKNTINVKFKLPMLKEVMEFIESDSKYMNDIEIRVHYLLIKMVIYNDENSYFKVKDMLIKDSRMFSHELINSIIINLQTFCVYGLIKGSSTSKEQFDIAKLRIKFNLLIENDQIPIDTFYMLFMLAVSQEEFDWAEKFLNKYSGYLNENFRNTALRYSRARLFYQKKEFEKALKELSKISSIAFIHYKPAIKMLQMMIYYDLKLISVCEDHAKTFIQFLRNDKLIPEEFKKVYKNFVSIYQKLLKVETSRSISKINDLMFYLDNYKRLVTGKHWFKTKLRELEVSIKKDYSSKVV